MLVAVHPTLNRTRTTKRKRMLEMPVLRTPRKRKKVPRRNLPLTLTPPKRKWVPTTTRSGRRPCSSRSQMTIHLA